MTTDAADAVDESAPGFRLIETLDLDDFRRPMQPIPERVESAIVRGARTDIPYTLADACRVIDEGGGGDGLVDCVIRNPDGQLAVACLTEMPGVSSAMWDWWFAWHSYTSERYRLWHPGDHRQASLQHDRRGTDPVRDAWVGNTSYVDEFIGGELQRLAIRFVEPSSIGLDEARVDEIGIAVCARTAIRPKHLAAGWLIHLVEDTEHGCRMHSRFLLGDVESEVPRVGTLITKLVNRPAVRRRLLPDQAGTALLRHCSEEMNHLATILPELYDRFGPGVAAPPD